MYYGVYAQLVPTGKLVPTQIVPTPRKKIGNKIAKHEQLFPTKIGIYQRFYPDISRKKFSRFNSTNPQSF